MRPARKDERLLAPNVFGSKIYSAIDLDADEVVCHFRRHLDKPAFVVCPGPSNMMVDPGAVVGKGAVFRMNTFMLEPEARFGRRVDGYFWSMNNDALYDEIEGAVLDKGYDIRAFFSPLVPKREDNSRDALSRYERLFNPFSDHWGIIATNPVLGREMMGRPLPTQAFQVLATLAVIGFREIHLIGVDMYTNKERRYAFDYPEHMKKRVDKKHYTPSYEKGAHGHERDIIFLESILSQFPKTTFFNASPVSPLREYLPDSPLMPASKAIPPAPAVTRAAPAPSPATAGRGYLGRLQHKLRPILSSRQGRR